MKSGFCVFVDTICQGPIPAWRDEEGKPVVYATEREAQADIADYLIERLHAFRSGELEFEEAIAVEDYVVPVVVGEDGSITTPEGGKFSTDSW